MAPITRSQWAFMRGACGTLLITRRSSAWKTVSNVLLYLSSRSRSRKRKRLHRCVEVGGEVLAPLGCPGLYRAGTAWRRVHACRVEDLPDG
jgi:hypothetical protein